MLSGEVTEKALWSVLKLGLRGGIEADKRTAPLIKQKSNENAEKIQGYSQAIPLLE
jgi:hypothetical protein